MAHFTEQEANDLKQVFENALKEAQKTKIMGFRAEDKSAWFSPQRDFLNQAPNIIMAAAAIAELEMTEDEQEKLGNLPLDLLVTAQGERGGVLCIPELIRKSYEEQPELTTRFMCCLGYGALLTLAFIPANYVNPEGLMESDIKSDVVLAQALEDLSPETVKKIKEELKNNESTNNVPFVFSDRMKEIASHLSDIVEKKHNEEKKEDDS